MPYKTGNKIRRFNLFSIIIVILVYLFIINYYSINVNNWIFLMLLAIFFIVIYRLINAKKQPINWEKELKKVNQNG